MCITQWEKRDVESHDTTLQTTSYTFPDANLIPTLVQQYFDHANILIPLLHRPSFEKDVGDQLYLRDQGFALVFLVVCSIGARYVDDPRVRLDGEGGGSAGWKWFNQLQMVRKSLWAAPSLHDIQMLAVRHLRSVQFNDVLMVFVQLAFIFLSSSSAPQACWSIAGIGIRYAQDVGAHRKKVYSSVPTPHEELWKRAFW